NPLSTGLLRRLYKTTVSDVHCGMRAFTKDAYEAMDLHTTGMEFASEMVIRASLSGMDIREVPIRFLPDGRGRKPHLRPWRDVCDHPQDPRRRPLVPPCGPKPDPRAGARARRGVRAGRVPA